MANASTENSTNTGRSSPRGAVVQLMLRGHTCYVTLARAHVHGAKTVLVNLPGGIPRRVSQFAVAGCV